MYEGRNKKNKGMPQKRRNNPRAIKPGNWIKCISLIPIRERETEFYQENTGKGFR